MNAFQGKTILVTGGASGIGLALAQRWLAAGNQVVVVGRRAEALAKAKARFPLLHTHVGDVETAADRQALHRWSLQAFPQLDVLVNNAGIQRQFDAAHEEPWEDTQQELAINLEAPIHLARLFLPHLSTRPQAAIVNVTSGLAFCPLARVAVYSATKAGLHSFTLSLRHRLRGTSVRVVEIIPPAVNTDLGGPGLHDFGVPLDAFADAVMERLQKGEDEVGYALGDKASRASRADLDQLFRTLNPA